MQNNILTVTQLNYSVKHQLEANFSHIWLVGEISNFSQPVSGHWYLTLKDEKAQVRCAMFRMQNQRVNFQPNNGMQVLVRANVSLYEPRGDYQILIETMQLAGDGLLQQQFEKLKMKLASEGLFAQNNKKPLPTYVKKIGIITSASGAALQDILQILKRRDPSLQVVIYPTLVQGKAAAQEIVSMIKLANLRKECDVLIVGRGGGSLEDLWCFNEEIVARALYHSDLPIISAVGHETDVTIADFVADLRAPTPSAAAELISRDQQELYRQLQSQLDRASLAFDRTWSEKIGYFQQLQIRLNAQHPTKQLKHQQERLIQYHMRIERAIYQSYKNEEKRLQQFTHRLQLQHPKQKLERQQQCLQHIEKSLAQAINQYLQHKQQHFATISKRVENNQLTHQISKLLQIQQQLEQRLTYAIDKKLNQKRQPFQQLVVQLESLSPLKVLSRGYSVTANQQGEVISDIEQVKIGEKIRTRLANGELISQVTHVL